MSYIGNSSTTQTYNQAVSYFNGNGSTTSFTLPYPVASAAQLIVTVNNVIQNPSSAFTVSGNTITFTSAPSSGTSNIWVEYASPVTQTVAPSAGSVNQAQLGTLTNLPLTSGTLGGGDSSSMKNRIINGAMVIDQRNAGASVTPTTINAQVYTLDRWAYQSNIASKFSVQQNAGSVTPPVGFTNYLGLTSLASTSVGSSDVYLLSQTIEGYNVADLNFGSANAKTITLSFQVYSSLTGTFGGSLTNGAENYSYPFSYTISAANTWTTISLTIAGPTAGTWLITNGAGLKVWFSLGVGSTYTGTAGAWTASGKYGATGEVNVVSTSGATFYITGVQLEVGSSATGFEYRQYGTELALCERYYELAGSGIVGIPNSSTQIYAIINYKVDKRATPSLSISTTTPLCRQYSLGDRTGSSSTVSTVYADTSSGSFMITGFSSVTTGSPGAFNTAGLFQLSAEL